MSVLLLLILLTGRARADIIYVHADSIYTTIQAGINAANPGDSVVVFPGTYSESISLVDSITVRSTGGSSQTIIAGGDSTETVFAYYPKDMTFGGPNAGFTVIEGSSFGLRCQSGDNVIFEDLLVMPSGTYQTVSGIIIGYGTDETVKIKDVEVRNQSNVGIWLDSTCDAVIEDTRIANIGSKGIRVTLWSWPSLKDVEIDSCETGLSVGWSWVNYDGGEIQNCETGIYFGYHQYDVSLDASDLEIGYCDIGIIAEAPLSVEANNLSCHNCTTGIHSVNRMILTNSDFYDIYDTGIYGSSTGDDTLIIGESGSTNSFYDIDGDAIYLGANCKAVVRSSFESVSGTAINCNTGTDNVDIVYSDFDGSGCFEGISTSGSGTLATVRNCDLYNYQAHTSPSPRAAIAYKATADYGTVSDNGDNDFHDNSTDLNYANRDASPDSLYAVKNWWGENPPDASSFAGRTGYIVYQPYRTTAPRLIPTDAVPAPAPEILAIRNTFPNPTSDHVTIRCQIPDRADAELLIWDVSGRIVRRIDIHPGDSEMVEISWDGTDGSDNHLPSGTYFCRLKSTLDSNTRRIVLTR